MTNHAQKLTELATRLIDQQAARLIVEPQERGEGFWFGGGNMIADDEGTFSLVGRYRNRGDSRTGVASGTRGLELAIFQSRDRGTSFQKILSFSKADLSRSGTEVLSIEGAALRRTPEGVELYVSTEKDGIGYPSGFEDFLKPGTGVWSIDRLRASTIEELASAAVEPFLACDDPAYLHVKDPFVYTDPQGRAFVLFCTHPFCWTSSNTGYVEITPGSVSEPMFDFFPRGVTWDVAMTRGTAVVDVPALGLFAERPASLFFYDGGECVRNLEEHATAVSRPRGYSCEELGGAAWIVPGDFSSVRRLSRFHPLFVSPHGTGCSRYVDVLAAPEGWYATWQQSQPDLSQPLVMNFLSREQIERILTD